MYRLAAGLARRALSGKFLVRTRRASPAAKLPMLRWRLPLGILIVAALVGLCWLDHLATLPGTYLLPLAALLVVLAGGELLQLLDSAGMRPVRWVVYGGSLLLLAAGWMPVLCWKWDIQASPDPRYLRSEFEGWTLLALALATLLGLLGEIRRYQGPGKTAANLAAAVFAVVYIGLMFAFLVGLRLVWGIGALASLVIVVKLGDTGAYTVGRLVGRHKMAPLLSPGKTIEGAIGGLGFAMFGSWVSFSWIVPRLTQTAQPGNWLTLVSLSSWPGSSWSGSSWPGWVVFGLLVGGAGMLGDLAESLLKREAAVSDSSRWLPGLGGVLDILDSILLAAPVAYACWAFGLVGP